VIPNTVWTSIVFNTVRYNDYGLWSATNPTRFTVVRAGTYVISGHVAFQGNAAGTARLATLWVDGAIYSAIQGMTNVVLSGPGNPFISVAETIKLQVGDWVELNVYQDSGASLSTLGGDAGGGWYCADFTMALIAGAKGDKGDTGPPGAGGGGGGGVNFEYTQASPSATWAITHNLGVHPSVTVVDTGGTVVLPDVHYDSLNAITVSFGSATSGKAYLN